MSDTTGYVEGEDWALKERLKGIIVTDEKNASREVPVWFAIPDLESRSQSYPYITVELIGIRWASYRQTSGEMVDNDLQGTVAPVAGKGYTYEMPVPWDLVYQVNVWTRHPRHDRAILKHLLTKVFPANRGYLAVSNELGTDTSYRHLILEEFVKRDTVENGRRLFRSIFTATVSSESVLGLAPATELVDTVNINTTTTHVPPGLQLP